MRHGDLDLTAPCWKNGLVGVGGHLPRFPPAHGRKRQSRHGLRRHRARLDVAGSTRQANAPVTVPRPSCWHHGWSGCCGWQGIHSGIWACAFEQRQFPRPHAARKTSEETWVVFHSFFHDPHYYHAPPPRVVQSPRALSVLLGKIIWKYNPPPVPEHTEALRSPEFPYIFWFVVWAAGIFKGVFFFFGLFRSNVKLTQRSHQKRKPLLRTPRKSRERRKLPSSSEGAKINLKERRKHNHNNDDIHTRGGNLWTAANLFCFCFSVGYFGQVWAFERGQ